MCNPMAVAGAQAGVGIIQSEAAAKANKQAADANWSIAQENAKAAEVAASDALRRGEVEAGKAIRKGSEVIAEQHVGLAAANVDISQGTALQLAQDAAMQAAQDAETIRGNAAREAWGLRMQGINFLKQGALEKDAAYNGATAVTIGGAANAGNVLMQGFAQSGYFSKKSTTPDIGIQTYDSGPLPGTGGEF